MLGPGRPDARPGARARAPRWAGPGSSRLGAVWVASLLVASAALVAPPPAQAQGPRADAPRQVVLWHAYRGAEEAALLEVVAAFNAAHGDLRVQALAMPYNTFANTLSTAIPHGNGPDLFIFAHERIGGWARSGHIAAVDEAVADDLADFFPETLEPLRFEEALYGLPLNFKSLALFYNRALLDAPPRTTDELIALGDRLAARGVFPLAYQATLFYFHAPWYFGFGGELFRDDDSVGYTSPGAVRSFRFVAELTARGLIPDEPTGALVTTLFNEGRAALVINGPWFTGEIDPGVDFGVASLPVVSETGRPATPFMTTEAVLVSGHRSVNRSDAVRVARWLAGRDSAITRAVVGRQVVAHRRAWEDARLAGDAILAAFRAQLPHTVPADNRPIMRTVWEPGDLALRKIMRGDSSAEEAAEAAAHRHAVNTRPRPAESSPTGYLIFAAALLIGLLALVLRWIFAIRRRGLGTDARRGWRWVAPAMIATVVLVILPFLVGLVLAFFSHEHGDWTFVGMGNFGEILGATGYGIFEPLSFYYALLVTLLWTILNLVLHVALGLGLALLLNRPLLRLRPVYRVILILPWAVPNYITALIWKGMFHKQFGAINGMLELIGVEGVSWFSSFPTAFFANLCTNAWLGFPFMMVIALGALQSIPQDLYQAAEVDGAGPWQRFKHITLPLLRPAMIPAVLLGFVWTFNQFNIIYLVSGGEPDNATDILISEAYRWAFERNDRFGFAAAYAALIFVLLLGWSLISVKAARAAEDLR